MSHESALHRNLRSSVASPAPMRGRTRPGRGLAPYGRGRSPSNRRVWYTYRTHRWAGHTHRLRRGDLRLKYQLDPVTFVGTAAWSTDFFGPFGRWLLPRGGVDVRCRSLRRHPVGRIGHQWIERNAHFARRLFPVQHLRSRPIAGGIAASLGWYAGYQPVDAGLKICDSRFFASVSWTFDGREKGGRREILPLDPHRTFFVYAARRRCGFPDGGSGTPGFSMRTRRRACRQSCSR